MIELRRILCPVDFSEYSSHAVAHAAALARWYRATLTLLHVWPLSPPPAPYDGLASAALLMLPEQRDASLARLTALAQSLAPDVTAEPLMEDGEPAHVILDVARSRSMDLLVLGTHGRSGFDRLVLGSVTEKLLHRAPCPVLTVPRHVGTAALDRVTYKRIVCALDEATATNDSFRFAHSLARESDAELVLLHVVEPLPEPALAEVGMTEATREVDVLARQWRTALDALITPEATEWCRLRARVETGKPGAEIVRVAQEEQADLVVLGVRGRGAVDLFVFGSTANRVVRHAGCPVLTVGVRAHA